MVSRLSCAGGRLGLRPGRTGKGLPDDLALAGLDLDPGAVSIAAKLMALLVFVSVMAGAFSCGALTGLWLPAVVPVFAAAGSVAAHALILSHPSRAASRLMKEVLRDSMGGTNLMIMSLRQEQSLPSAMVFASRGAGAFRRELRRCIWDVVMARHAGFEEALQTLGDRFARYCNEFKTSMDALVTASCESTPEGLRRALDRANEAMVSGAKRRIEEYALSLSTPSMVMFGVGILLPLMVGSFLPMLSWDLWSTGDGVREAGVPGSLAVTLETVLVMNVLFPAIALFVALSISSRHPFRGSRSGIGENRRWHLLAAVLSVSSAGVAASVFMLDGLLEAFGVLWSATAPAAVVLATMDSADGHSRLSGPALESALFRTGARMAEGKNFEKAFAESAAEAVGLPGTVLRRLCLSCLMPAGREDGREPFIASQGDARNCVEALEVVRKASTKDEPGAGVLAMDLAAYLKDLSDLDATLRLRLRPMVSMMRVTAYALAPVVLGVTFAMYLSLASIAGVESEPGEAGGFLLVLGLFLAETNASVMYFVWAIEGGGDRGRLMASVGQCVLCSGIVYSATALLVAG
jgi:hypothetical protein